jgi:hypothetical protein
MDMRAMLATAHAAWKRTPAERCSSVLTMRGATAQEKCLYSVYSESVSATSFSKQRGEMVSACCRSKKTLVMVESR